MSGGNTRWAGYSTDELLVALEEEHGPEAARIAYRCITGELPPKFVKTGAGNATHVHRRGEKERRKPSPLPQTRSTNPYYREELKERWWRNGKLPRSGAGPARKGLTDLDFSKDAS